MNVMKIDFPFNSGQYGSLQRSLSSGLLFFISKVLGKLGLNFTYPKLGIHFCLIKLLFKKRFSLVITRLALYSQWGNSCWFEIQTMYLK